ncbi:MAG: PKD domain-containing protein [Bacteroidales bacterium]|nr:PKD domain-containing protein [Bacteroidales bacterium]
MKKILTALIVFLLFLMLFHACSKVVNEPELELIGQIEFSIDMSKFKSANEGGLNKVVVSIEDSIGNIIINSEEFAISNSNGHYSIEPISLEQGNYQIKKFLVLNVDDRIVYASPIFGKSSDYSLTADSAAIFFKITSDELTIINPLLINATGYTPENFGYESFGYEIAESFDFYIGAFIFNESNQNYELTDAEISIYDPYFLVYSGLLESKEGVTTTNFDEFDVLNKITLPENYKDFEIEISKNGFLINTKKFSKEELRLHRSAQDNGPLVIILEKCEDLAPTLTTSTASNITSSVAIGGGKIEYSGQFQIKYRGVCWSESPNPTIKDSITYCGSGTGEYSCLITGLKENTQYYAKSWASTDCGGITYGNEILFKIAEKVNIDSTSFDGSAMILAYPHKQLWPDATVFFENNSLSDADSYLWDFGDGTILSQTTFVSFNQYTYSKYGRFEIKLAVTKNGHTSVDQTQIVILEDAN